LFSFLFRHNDRYFLFSNYDTIAHAGIDSQSVFECHRLCHFVHKAQHWRHFFTLLQHKRNETFSVVLSLFGNIARDPYTFQILKRAMSCLCILSSTELVLIRLNGFKCSDLMWKFIQKHYPCKMLVHCTACMTNNRVCNIVNNEWEMKSSAQLEALYNMPILQENFISLYAWNSWGKHRGNNDENACILPVQAKLRHITLSIKRFFLTSCYPLRVILKWMGVYAWTTCKIIITISCLFVCTRTERAYIIEPIIPTHTRSYGKRNWYICNKGSDLE